MTPASTMPNMPTPPDPADFHEDDEPADNIERLAKMVDKEPHGHTAPPRAESNNGR